MPRPPVGTSRYGSPEPRCT